MDLHDVLAAANANVEQVEAAQAALKQRFVNEPENMALVVDAALVEAELRRTMLIRDLIRDRLQAQLNASSTPVVLI